MSTEKDTGHVVLSMPPFIFRLPWGFRDLRGPSEDLADLPAELVGMARANPTSVIAGRPSDSAPQTFTADVILSPGPLDERKAKVILELVAMEDSAGAGSFVLHEVQLFEFDGVVCARAEAEWPTSPNGARTLIFIMPSAEKLAIVQYSASGRDWTQARPDFERSAMRTLGIARNTGSAATYWGWRIGYFLRHWR